MTRLCTCSRTWGRTPGKWAIVLHTDRLTLVTIIVPQAGDEGLVYTPNDKEQINALNVPPESNVVCKCEKVRAAHAITTTRQ